MKRDEIVILLTLAFVQFTHILDNMVMMPMGPLFKESFNIDSGAFNLLVGSYGLAAFVSAIGATFWMDRFDRKRVLLFLYCGFLLGTFACTMAPDYNYFLAARVFTGLFGGVAGAVILSIVGDLIPLERRAQGMGILMSGFALASVAGVPIGIFLSEAFSWHAPFYLICGIGVFVLLSIIFVIPPLKIHLQNRHTAPPVNIYRAVLSNANQRMALLFSLLFVMAHFAIIPNITDYLKFNLGFRLNQDLVWMYVVGGVLSTFSSPLWGKLADKYGRAKVFAILSMLAIIPLFLVTNFTGTTLLSLLPVSAMFFIFSGGRMIPASAMVTSTVPPQMRGNFMSLNSAVQQLGAGATSIIMGQIITNDGQKHLHNYEYVGYIAIALTVLAVIIAYRIRSVDGKKL